MMMIGGSGDGVGKNMNMIAHETRLKQAIAARSMLSYARGRMLQCQTATRPSKLKIHRLCGFQYLVTEVKFNPVHPILATLHLNGKV